MPVPAAPSSRAANSPPRRRAVSCDPLLPRKYRELIRRYLGKPLGGLFAELTGVHFHVAWAPAAPRPWAGQALPTGCSVCRRLAGAARNRPGCKSVEPCGHLARALNAHHGHRFVCRGGLLNYWCPIRVRGQTLGLACLQALDRSNGQPVHTARLAPPVADPPRPILAAVRGRLDRTGARLVSESEFARDARFLHHIVEYAQTASLSDLRKADLATAGRAVVALEKEQVRLRSVLDRHLPPAPQAPSQFVPQSHAEQVVHRLLGCLELDYEKPVTLRQYACSLGMNAAYLSTLFSRTVGMPFKAYLTELRIERAKTLLGDPTKTASEVAFAVGYASENRFRAAFKKVAGLAPKSWRETIHIARQRGRAGLAAGGGIGCSPAAVKTLRSPSVGA